MLHLPSISFTSVGSSSSSLALFENLLSVDSQFWKNTTVVIIMFCGRHLKHLTGRLNVKVGFLCQALDEE